MNTIDYLKQRYATKKFDSTKKISQEELNKLKEAINLSPSSYGLQLYKVAEVVGEEKRGKLKEYSWGQSQITDASDVFIFCNFQELKDEYVDDYIQLKSSVQGIPSENLTGYGDFMKQKLKEKSFKEGGEWAARQVYIAASSLMIAAAELGIDTCPIEGFEVNQVNELFNFPAKNLSAAVIVAIGHRSDEDQTQNAPKVRKELDQIFFEA